MFETKDFEVIQVKAGKYFNNETVIILGRGFGEEQNSGSLSIGRTLAKINLWSDGCIQAEVPRNLSSGFYKLELRCKGQSNGQFQILTLNDEDRQALSEHRARLLLIAQFKGDSPNLRKHQQVVALCQQAFASPIKDGKKVIPLVWPDTFSGPYAQQQAQDVLRSNGADLMVFGSINKQGRVLAKLVTAQSLESPLPAEVTALTVQKTLLSFDCHFFSLKPQQSKQKLEHFLSAWFSFVFGDYEQARALLVENMGKRLSNSERASCHFLTGHACMALSQHEYSYVREAHNHFEQAAQIYREQGQTLEEGRCCLNLAAVCLAMGRTHQDLVGQLEYLRLAIKIFEDGEYFQELSWAHSNLTQSLEHIANLYQGYERVYYLSHAMNAAREMGQAIAKREANRLKKPQMTLPRDMKHEKAKQKWLTGPTRRRFLGTQVVASVLL